MKKEENEKQRLGVNEKRKKCTHRCNKRSTVFCCRLDIDLNSVNFLFVTQFDCYAKCLLTTEEVVFWFVCLFVYLFSGVRWQIEYENSEEGNANAGDDQIYSVKQSLPSQSHVECNV